MEKDKWIDHVLGQTRYISRAQAPHDLHDNVMAGLSDARRGRVIALPAAHWAAAAILLLALNIGSALYAIGQNKKAATTASTAVSVIDIPLETTYNY